MIFLLINLRIDVSSKDILFKLNSKYLFIVYDIENIKLETELEIITIKSYMSSI